MSHLELISTQELAEELGRRFETIIFVGKQAKTNESAEASELEVEEPYFQYVRGDAADMNWMCDIVKHEVMDAFMASGRDAEEWER